MMSIQQENALFEQVPRSLFVSNSPNDQVCGHRLPTRGWVDYALHHIVFNRSQNVLQVGTGSGYVAALLARLTGSVVTIEKDPKAARGASDRLQELGLGNVQVVTGSGETGFAESGPYDLIFVSTPSLKDIAPLTEQLKAGGSLYTVEQTEANEEILVRYQPSGSSLSRIELGVLPRFPDISRALLNIDGVDSKTLEAARQLAASDNEALVEVVRRFLGCDEVDFYRNVASEMGIPYRDIESLLPDVQLEFFGRFSRAFLDLIHLIPIRHQEDSILIASYDPCANISDIKKLYPAQKIELVLLSATSYHRLWSTLELALQGEINDLESFRKVVATTDSARDANDKQAQQKQQIESHLGSVLDAILLDAASEKASDIHIEQFNGNLRLRLRVDGELREFNRYHLSQREIKGLVNVIKIRANMDIAEKRIPQGGRSQMVVGKTQYDLRIQVQPSLHGEYVVIRLLPQTGTVIAIEELGLSDEIAKAYHRLLRNPAGMVLVVGPTGSGKSTTLYAGLQVLANDVGRKVITVEDPIEYDIHNIQQTQVNPEIGFHFSDAMRSFVRLDPDVIFVGEIRDHETALEALRASQTGHLVLSTLHCNDATDAAQRLFDLEVHPNSISSELMAIVAQRLAKRICQHCKHEVTPDPLILRELYPKEVPADFKAYAGRGCNHCNQHGTSGRVAVVEYLPVNDAVKEAISRKASALEIRQIALESGLITLRDSALQHVMDGLIPLSEIPRILSSTRMAPERPGTPVKLRAI